MFLNVSLLVCTLHQTHKVAAHLVKMSVSANANGSLVVLRLPVVHSLTHHMTGTIVSNACSFRSVSTFSMASKRLLNSSILVAVEMLLGFCAMHALAQARATYFRLRAR